MGIFVTRVVFSDEGNHQLLRAQKRSAGYQHFKRYLMTTDASMA